MPTSLNGFNALHHRNFTLFLCAKLLATIAVQMQGVAVGWQVYAFTGDVLDLGLVGLSQFAPFAVLVLAAGQVADRWDRRSIISLCFGVEMVCGLLLLAFTVTGLRVVWPVFVIMALYGAARAFVMPASQAILVNLVPAESFSKAVALSSSTFHLAVIAGPTLGGLLYLTGPDTVYAIVASLLAASALLMLLIRTDWRGPASQEPASWHSLLEGLRLVWSRPVVLGAISLDFFAVLFGGAVALLPAYASDILHVGPIGLGLLRTAPAVGAALTAIVLAFRPTSYQVGSWMFGGVALFGAATIVFGISESFPLSLGTLFLIGAGDMISVYIRHVLVQLRDPRRHPWPRQRRQLCVHRGLERVG